MPVTKTRVRPGRIAVLVSGLLSLAAASGASGQVAEESQVLGGKILFRRVGPAGTEFEAALEEARRTDQLLLLFFT